MDQRDMRHHGNLPSERTVDLSLARRVGETIVASDTASDPMS